MSGVRLLQFAALAFAFAASGCVSVPARIPYGVADLASDKVLDDGPIRFWAKGDDEKYRKWSATVYQQRQAASLPLPHTVLALSGGTDKGAYSAGFLNAWSGRGTRPSFDIVTGVSTGSLIAPFAFLGPDEDATLKQIYTTISRKDVYREHILKGLFGGSSVLGTKPLQSLIARYVTADFLDRIAAQHRLVRRLLVMTTNLDAERGMIWDMGAIATSDSPRRLALFRQVLLASSSIPGAFPPVLVDVTANGRHFAEMHVDGGTVGGFFVLPRAMLALSSPQSLGDGAIYVLYNGRLTPDFDVVTPHTFTILTRALSTVLTEIDRSSIDDFRLFAAERKARFVVCSIEQPTAHDAAPLFDTVHMRELYALGAADAVAANGCLSASRIVPGDHL